MPTEIQNTNADYQKHVIYDDEMVKLYPHEKSNDTMFEAGDKTSFIFKGNTYFVSGDGFNGRDVPAGEILNDPYVAPIPHAIALVDHKPTQEGMKAWRESLPVIQLGQKIWVKHYGFHTISEIFSMSRCVFIRDRDGMRTYY